MSKTCKVLSWIICSPIAAVIIMFAVIMTGTMYVIGYLLGAGNIFE